MNSTFRLFIEIANKTANRQLPIDQIPVWRIKELLMEICKNSEWVDVKMEMLAQYMKRQDYDGCALFFYEIMYLGLENRKRAFKEYASYSFRKNILSQSRDNGCFKGKGVIYTVLTGNYEALKEPEFVDPRFDYVCFTDDDNLRSEVWSIQKLEDTENLGSKRLSRKPKILVNAFLGQYDFSVYIDCQFKIKGDLYQYIYTYSMGASMLCFPHGGRDCVYEEAKACIGLQKDNEEIIHDQVERYRKSGMPEHYGLISAGCMVRSHRDQKLNKVMNDWWEEILNGCCRDQISFPYVSWKNDFRYDVSDLYIGYNEYIEIIR